MVSMAEQPVYLKNQKINGSTAVDEITEIIFLPALSCGNRKPNKVTDVELGEAVEEQMRDYVYCIASSYRSNPFHNYEHVSIFIFDLAHPEASELTTAFPVHFRRRAMFKCQCSSFSSASRQLKVLTRTKKSKPAQAALIVARLV